MNRNGGLLFYLFFGSLIEKRKKKKKKRKRKLLGHLIAIFLGPCECERNLLDFICPQLEASLFITFLQAPVTNPYLIPSLSLHPLPQLTHWDNLVHHSCLQVILQINLWLIFISSHHSTHNEIVWSAHFRKDPFWVFQKVVCN